MPSSEFEPIGVYPTPVHLLPTLGTRDAELWVKRDDLTHPAYGGNKVRKLERLLARARERGAERLVTVGAVGSHHVLATTYFARRFGLAVDGVLFPQPRTKHVVEVLRAGVALGLRAHPAPSLALVPFVAASRLGRGALFVPPGGSNVAGALGYVDAARELAAQVRAGTLPEPDVCVVALGSGGTAAGLAAGFAAEGMKTRVVGAAVVGPPWIVAAAARMLLRACATRGGTRRRARLSVDARFLGRGYGEPTEPPEQGRAALRDAEGAGIELDPTYTAKAFACALWHVRARQARHVLYWHTLSSAPMAPHLAGAPAEEALDPRLRALLRRSPTE